MEGLQQSAHKLDPSTGEGFRLQKCCEIQDRLEKEKKHYANMRKKYGRIRAVVVGSGIIGGGVSTILSAGSFGSALTGVGLIFATIPLGIAAGIASGFSALCLVYTRRHLDRKISKHEKTIILANAKLNTVRDLVSKALANNSVSDDEFTMILEEFTKYESLKAEIRRKHREDAKRQVNEAKLREDVRAEMLKDLVKSLPPKKG